MGGNGHRGLRVYIDGGSFEQPSFLEVCVSIRRVAALASPAALHTTRAGPTSVASHLGMLTLKTCHRPVRTSIAELSDPVLETLFARPFGIAFQVESTTP
eukprot:269268-Hanusia_phi.AAC.1